LTNVNNIEIEEWFCFSQLEDVLVPNAQLPLPRSAQLLTPWKTFVPLTATCRQIQ